MRNAFAMLVGLVLATAAGGCNTAPDTPPMDEPLSPGTAMEADEEMSQSTGSLVRERQQKLD